MNKFLPKMKASKTKDFNFPTKLLLVLFFSGISWMTNAQTSGPYSFFESFRPAGSRATMISTDGWAFNPVGVTPATNIAQARSGINILNLGNAVNNTVTTPALTNPNVFKFYYKCAAATGTVTFTVDWSADNFGTTLGSITGTVASGTTYTPFTLTTANFGTNASLKFRITITAVVSPGALMVDDVSCTSTVGSENNLIVPETGSLTSTQTVPIPGGNLPGFPNVAPYFPATFKFYDQGGLYDNYGKSQTKTDLFAPTNSGDRVKITFYSYIAEASTNIAVYEWNGSSNVATLLAPLTGNSAEQMGTPTSYITTTAGNSLKVVYTQGTTQAGASITGYNTTVECVSNIAITSLSVAAGCVGVPVTINGSGLAGATAVTINGVAATINSNTATQIVVTPAAGSVGTGTVSVTAPTGTANYSSYTVYGLPTAAASNNGPVCAGTALTLSGGASGGSGSGYAYAWSGPSYASASQNPTVSASATVALSGNTYILTVTDSNLCVSNPTSSTTVTVNAAPTTSVAGSNQSFCLGGTATLAANTPVVGTGAWTVSGPSSLTSQFSSTSSPTAVFTPAGGAGTYTLTWSISASGCTASTSSLTVTVNALPSFSSTSLAAQTLCLSSGATALSVTAVAGSGSISTYQWYSNTVASTSGGIAVGTSTNTYTPVTSSFGTLYYYCTVTNSFGCSFTSPVSGAIAVVSAPSAPVAAAATSIGASTFTANWAASANASGYFLDVSTSNTFGSFVSGYSNLSVGNVTTIGVSGLLQGTTYYYRVRANNTCGTSANSGTITVTTTTLSYCTPTYSTGDNLGDQITNVTLGTLSNASGASASPYYTFYNAVTIPNIYQGGTASISVTMGPDFRQYIGVWIDFNQNGTFETSEGFVSVNNAGANGTATLTITIPGGALLGNTRMRVRGGDDNAMTTAMACGATNSIYGETEDYIVNIITVPPCTASLPSSISNSFVTATTAVISWADASLTPNSVYEYYVSTSSTPPSNASGTVIGTTVNGITTVNLSGLTLGNTYYVWVRSNCGSGVYSNWVGSTSFTTVLLDIVVLNSSSTGGSKTTCNAKFYDSGNATGNYQNSESYTYTFVPGSAGSKLKAVFNSFQVESNFDYLSIYNGTTVTAANLIGTYTGTQIAAGQTFFSTAAGGELTFKFTSDGSVTFLGWDVALTCVTMPSITSFTPTNACAGATPVVTITGTNLAGVTSVSFNGVTATPTSTTATTVVVNLPATATTGVISVSTATATATSASSFTIKAIPNTPNAGPDVSVCSGGSTTLNATGTVANQVIVQNNCSTLAGWTTNDVNRWLVSPTNNAGGTTGELDFNWNASGVVSDYIYLNQIINTTGYTGVGLTFKSNVSWFSNSFNLYVETSPDLATWTTQWNITPTANVAAGTVNVNLAALSGTSFYIRFRYSGDAFYINDWFIDDVTVTGQPALTYTWASNATLSSTTIYNPVATTTSTQTYTVSTSLNGCSSATDDVIVSVNPKPTAVISGTQSICNGATAPISIALTGTAPWSVTYTNGVTPVTVTGILTSPYTFTTPSISSTTTYTVTALSDTRCAAAAGDMTGSAVITISTAPSITPAASATGVCYSNSTQVTTLTYSATSGTLATYSIVWNSGSSAGVTTVSDAAFPGTGSVNVNVPGNLTLGTNNATITVKNTNGCISAGVSFTVLISPSPSVTITTSTITVCYSAASQTASFPYIGANTLNQYDVTWNATPANSFAAISNANFTTTTGNINITVPAGTPAGTYIGTVTPRNASCGLGAAPRTINVIVSDPSIIPAASATTVCYNASAQTTPLTYTTPVSGPTLYSIVWNASPANTFAAVTNQALPASPISIAVPAGTAPGTYTGTISVSNAAGCISQGYVFTVTVGAYPTITLTSSTTKLCASTSAQTTSLAYTASTNTPISYSIDWNSAANTAGLADQGVTAFPFINGADTINTIVITANTPANLYSGNLSVINATGCITTYPITISIGKMWNGSTSSDWATASNWTPSGVPTATDCVVIPSGTTYSADISANAFANNLTVNASATLSLDSGYVLEVQDFVKTNGTFNVSNNASLVQINNVANSGTGNMVYNRDVNALHGFDYVYWSSPVAAQNIATLYNTPTEGYHYYWDTLANNNNGASGNTGQGNWSQAFGAMQVGKGYIVRGSTLYGWTGNLTSSFTGIPNNGDILMSVLRGSYTGAPYTGSNGITISNMEDNYNLIGNPYPSAIKAIDFLNLPSNTSKIQGAIYLWTHYTVPTSNANTFYSSGGYNYFSSDYLAYNSAGASSGPGFNGYIAAGQGFFVAMNDGPADSTQSVVFNNSMRDKTYANTNFFKSTQNTVTQNNGDRIWLDLVDANNQSSRTLVGYFEGASVNKDRNFDAFTKVGGGTIIYSLVEGESDVIQGRPAPFDDNDRVQLGFYATTTGNYSIAIGAVDGLFEQGQAIYLEDTLLNIIYDLRQAPYNFSTTSGQFNDRFVLRYTNSNLANNQFATNSVAAFVNKEKLQIKATTTIDTVQIYDVAGKQIISFTPASKSNEMNENFPFANGVYFAKIKLEDGSVITQKLMN